MNRRMNPSVVLLLVVLLCATAQAQEKLQNVKIASGGHIVHFLPLDLAVALGYFKDEGLEPEITYLKGGTATAQALISKQVDFSTNSIDHAFKAAAKGRDDLRMVVLLNQTPGMVLVVDSKYKDSVKTIADLKGKRLGVTSPGSATHMVLAYLLSKNGVNLSGVTIVKAGSSTFPPALKHGSIDGGIALEPFASTMVEQDDAFILQRLISMKDSQVAFGGPYNQAGILTRKDIIASNPDLVQKVVSVHVRALKWIQSHTEEETADVLSSEVVGSDKARYIKTLRLLKEFYSPNGVVNAEGASNVLESMKVAGIFPDSFSESASKFFTNQYLAITKHSPMQSSSPSGVKPEYSPPDNVPSLSIKYVIMAFIIGILSSAIASWLFHNLTMKSHRQQHRSVLSDLEKVRLALKGAEEAATKSRKQWLEDLGFMPLSIGVSAAESNGLTLFEDKICDLATKATRNFKMSVMTPLLHSLSKPWSRYNNDALTDASHWAHGFCEKLVDVVRKRKLNDDIELEIDIIYVDDKLLRKILQFIPDIAIKDFEGYQDAIQKFFSRLQGNNEHKFCKLHYCQVPETPFYFALTDVPTDEMSPTDTTAGAMAFINCQDLIKQRIEGKSAQEMARNMQAYAFTNPEIVKFMARIFESLALQKDRRLYSFYQQCATHDYELGLVMKDTIPSEIMDVIKEGQEDKVDFLLLRIKPPESGASEGETVAT